MTRCYYSDVCGADCGDSELENCDSVPDPKDVLIADLKAEVPRLKQGGVECEVCGCPLVGCSNCGAFTEVCVDSSTEEVVALQAEVERLKRELNESNKSLQKAEGEMRVALQEAFVAKGVSKFLMRDLGEHLEPFCEKMEKAKLEKALQEARVEAVREFAKWCDEEVPCGLTWTDDRGVHDIEAVEAVNRFIVEKYPW